MKHTDARTGMHGKVAVVTGASQGIGQAVAEVFAENGMHLVLTDLTNEVKPVAEDIVRRYPDSGAVGIVTDVTNAEACDALIAAAVALHGRVDVLAHATAIAQRKVPVVQLAPEEWDRVMEVNAKGAFLLFGSGIGEHEVRSDVQQGMTSRGTGSESARLDRCVFLVHERCRWQTHLLCLFCPARAGSQVRIPHEGKERPCSLKWRSRNTARRCRKKRATCAASFEAAYGAGLRCKISLLTDRKGDATLGRDLLTAMSANGANFTLAFCRLRNAALGSENVPNVRTLFADPGAFDECVMGVVAGDCHRAKEACSFYSFGVQCSGACFTGIFHAIVEHEHFHSQEP